jgi:hypothetical protein
MQKPRLRGLALDSIISATDNAFPNIELPEYKDFGPRPAHLR